MSNEDTDSGDGAAVRSVEGLAHVEPAGFGREDRITRPRRSRSRRSAPAPAVAEPPPPAPGSARVEPEPPAPAMNWRRSAGLRRYRTIWLSDVHLGAKACQAELLLDFLKHHECEQLYLVGDILDGWKMASRFEWPVTHTHVVRRLLQMARRGTRVTYIVGNHDEFLRLFVRGGLIAGQFHVANEAIHTTADGRRLLIVHGDRFDFVTSRLRRLARWGDHLYSATIKADRAVNLARTRLGKDEWPISAVAKQTVKKLMDWAFDFESRISVECRRRGLDGVVCGHIHRPEIREIHSIAYHNCGDWIDSCTALAEDGSGTISLIQWPGERYS